MNSDLLASALILIIFIYGIWRLTDRSRVSKTHDKIFLDHQLIEGFTVREAISVADMSTGLRNHHSLDDHVGFMFSGKSLQTTGMNFPIDVVFMNKTGNIISIIHGCPAGKNIIFGPYRTRKILELNEGRSMDYGLEVGKVIHFGEEKV